MGNKQGLFLVVLAVLSLLVTIWTKGLALDVKVGWNIEAIAGSEVSIEELSILC